MARVRVSRAFRPPSKAQRDADDRKFAKERMVEVTVRQDPRVKAVTRETERRLEKALSKRKF